MVHNKKILILTATANAKVFAGSAHEAGLLAGAARLEKQLTHVRVSIAAINELVIAVTDNKVTIRDSRNDNIDISEYDFVRLINVTRARDHFQAVSFYLSSQGVKYSDPQDTIGTPFGKISQMVRFALDAVSVPDTIAVWNTPLFAESIVQKMTLPFICKINQGTKGQYNFLIKSQKEFAEVLQQHGSNGYVVQPFIPNDGDYRVLYMGAQRLIFYRRAQSDSHLNNAAQNGQGTLVIPEACDPRVLDIAERAYSSYGHQVGGVDVIVHRTTNEPYILEVNDTPAILGGLYPEEKSIEYATFIADSLVKE